MFSPPAAARRRSRSSDLSNLAAKSGGGQQLHPHRPHDCRSGCVPDFAGSILPSVPVCFPLLYGCLRAVVAPFTRADRHRVGDASPCGDRPVPYQASAPQPFVFSDFLFTGSSRLPTRRLVGMLPPDVFQALASETGFQPEAYRIDQRAELQLTRNPAFDILVCEKNPILIFF